MSEDEDEESEETKPKTSRALEEIKRLMTTEGIDYLEAYGRVIEGKKPQEPDLPELPSIEPRLKQIKEMMGKLAFEMGIVERDKEIVQQLQDVIDEENVRTTELTGDIEVKLNNVNVLTEALEKRSKKIMERERELKDRINVLTMKQEEVDKIIEEEKQKRKGYVKKISSSAKEEFEKD